MHKLHFKAVVVASGPSLKAEQIAKYSLYTTRAMIAVNDAYRIMDRVDLLYACDPDWWDLHASKTEHIENRWTTNEDAARKFGLNHIQGEHYANRKCYFDTSGEMIIYGGNSGFQAINLAWILGVRDIVLLGYDMGFEANEHSHFFGDHPSHMNKASPFKVWIDHFNNAAPIMRDAGLRIVNATPGSRLQCFPKIATGIEDVD